MQTGFSLVPRRGTISLAVGETYGTEASKTGSDPVGVVYSTASGSGAFSFVIAVRRFHLRLMTFLPFGEGRWDRAACSCK